MIETSPGVYAQEFTATFVMPKWAVAASLVLCGLAGAAPEPLSVQQKNGPVH